MATRHRSFNAALLLTVLAAVPLTAQSGIAWPRPNHQTTSLVLAPWYGGTRHQSAHQIGVRAELNWFDSTGAVPSPAGIGFGLGAALFAGRGERQDGFGLYTSASVQLSDHLGSWTNFGKRIQVGAEFLRVPTVLGLRDQFDIPLSFGINWQPPLSGLVPGAYLAARAQLRYYADAAHAGRATAGAGVSGGIALRISQGKLHDLGIHLNGDLLWLADPMISGSQWEPGFSVGLLAFLGKGL